MSTAVGYCGRCGGRSSSSDSQVDPSQDRVFLRDRLAQLSDLIATFSAERQKLQAVSDSIVYPVLLLPPEITSLIFLNCLPDASPFPQPSPLSAPLLLAQICRQWRDIAIASPGLWQSIGLIDTRSVGVFETWLARSGNHPLNLSLNCVDPERAASLIDVCIPHAHRWQDIHLALPVGLLMRLKLQLPMPLLSKISLSLRGPFSREQLEEGAPDDPILLPNAPILREADIGTYPDLRFELPWAQLTGLTLAKSDIAECFAILKMCPDLVTLDVSTIGPPPAPIDTHPLVLANLRSFTCATDFCPVIERLWLPRLTSLHIRETVAADTAHTTHLQALIAQSAPPIQRLILALKYPSSETLERTLDAVPNSLRVLELHCGNATHVAPLLAALRHRGVLPELTNLAITGGRVFDDDYDAFPALLETRAATLREFSLMVQTYGRADAVRDVPLRMRAMPKLNALAEAGMKIRVAISGRFRIGTEVLLDTLG
ncbi:F-box domain-containing protein [Mycena sanguinolenta]|uniref:F-box domain-containing protein n=1 Tax=Mycena sanguinolenta TaxID=230812 RepID=A0A8H7CFA0_9AGAR|nr:F-box domain-containing protein [Mycena sanguinolenta]